MKLDELEQALQKAPSPALVSIQLANSETGIIQDIKAIVKLALQYKAFIHTDATQAFGKININFEDLGVDCLSIAAHKIGGPQGVGALIYKKGLHFNAIINGGGQQYNFRSGTENIAAISGFAKATELIELPSSDLRDSLEDALEKSGWYIFGKNSNRLPNTILASDRKTPAETQLIKADLANIQISAGSACSSGKIANSYVLEALGEEPELIKSAIRISLGRNTTQEDINYFIEKIT